MRTICRISAQYEENYGDSVNPHWKFKGAVEFNLNVDADDFIYSEEICVMAIKKLLTEAESNNCCRYTYVSHELVFSSIKMDDKLFEATLTQFYEAREKLWSKVS
jgi:hypothetical protein